MDVLLQSSKTALYLKHDLSWTARREEAYAFISSGEAIDFAFENRLDEVHMVLYFKDLLYSLVVPFQNELAGGVIGMPLHAHMDRAEPV